MTKRELIVALEACDAPDDAPVLFGVPDDDAILGEDCLEAISVVAEEIVPSGARYIQVSLEL